MWACLLRAAGRDTSAGWGDRDAGLPVSGQGRKTSNLANGSRRLHSEHRVVWEATAVSWPPRPSRDKACLLPPDEGAGKCDADALHEVPEDVDHRAPQVDVAAVLARMAVPVTVAGPCRLTGSLIGLWNLSDQGLAMLHMHRPLWRGSSRNALPDKCPSARLNTKSHGRLLSRDDTAVWQGELHCSHYKCLLRAPSRWQWLPWPPAAPLSTAAASLCWCAPPFIGALLLLLWS